MNFYESQLMNGLTNDFELIIKDSMMFADYTENGKFHIKVRSFPNTYNTRMPFSKFSNSKNEISQIFCQNAWWPKRVVKSHLNV